MLHRRFILNQILRSKKQAVVFVFCVALSFSGLFALDVFSSSVNRSLLKDARKLHAADIIIRSRAEISESLAAQIHTLEARGWIRSGRTYEFYSMVRAAEAPGSLLSHLKIVAPSYPFYGEVVLASGRPFGQVLVPGTAVVEGTLLERLHLGVGDHIKVGNHLLTIADVVLEEPDRPLTLYAFGPRVFAPLGDLEALDLVKPGSRIRYRWLIQVQDPGNLRRIVAELQAQASDAERVDTFRTAESRIKRFFDNFLFFLGLIGIFTLLLAGIGIQSTLSAFLREMEKSIAVMQTVGATSRFLTLHFLVIAWVLGGVGGLIGLGVGFGVQRVLLALFSGLLPENIFLSVTASAVAKGMLLALMVVSVFAWLPLHRIKALKPNAVFRKERVEFKRDVHYYLSGVVILIFLLMMALWMLEDVKTGAYFVLGIVLLVLLTAAFTHGVLYGVRKMSVTRLTLRQAVKGLFRPGNATRSIVVTLAASLTVPMTIYTVERNLEASFIHSYPPDAPNLFFLDIQPSQKEAFSKLVDGPHEYHPIVRARIVSINGETIDRRQERRRRGDNLARDFNLTYRNHLLEDEVVREGKGLFRRDVEGVQVSVLDTVQEMRPIRIGDRIVFRIQGVPVEATVTSIRSRTQESIRPFFYFVFQPEVLKDAPQTIFTALKVEKDKIARLQNTVVSRLPNVSIIDLTETVRVLAKVLRKLSVIIRFFMSFSIAAGVLIIISSLLATRFARIREAVYFKILGAPAAFILRVFALENLLIGALSTVMALIFSQAGSLIITQTVLDITYRPFLGAGVVMAAGSICMVAAVGLISSITVLRKRPVVFLREQLDE